MSERRPEPEGDLSKEQILEQMGDEIEELHEILDRWSGEEQKQDERKTRSG